MIKSALERISRGSDLNRRDMLDAMAAIMDGDCPPAQIAGFLIGLRVKGETVDELIGAATALRDRALALPAGHGAELDVVGTGGDGAHSINLSTAAALVAASLGVAVAKHGNRAYSSRCGSADVLERLGIPIDLTPAQAAGELARANFCYMFAPAYHPAMKAVAGIRRELGTPTLFNMLGPLTNPARVRAQLVGIGDAAKIGLYAQALRGMGIERGYVVSGEMGLDEIAPCGATLIADIARPDRPVRRIGPRDFGLDEQPLSSIRGGDPAVNAGILFDVLRGEKLPARTAVLMNASAALVAAGRATDFRDGAGRAAGAIDGGLTGRGLSSLQRVEAVA